MKKLAILVLLYLSIAGLVQGQQTNTQKLREAVNAKTFVFESRQASGMRGRMIQLDPGYTLDVSPEKVVANLPFFGRAYSSTPGQIDEGLKFELTEYDYAVKPRKKGGWDVSIKPIGTGDIRSVTLTIQTSGYASLRIISNSKDPMSYSGIIK